MSAESSLPFSSKSPLSGPAMSISCIFETRSARSNAVLGSTTSVESAPLPDFAERALSNAPAVRSARSV